MKKSLYSQIAGVVLCAGVILTLVWGCNDVPQSSKKVSKPGFDTFETKDSLEVEHLYDMAWELLNKNPDSSKIIAEEMIKKSEASGYKLGVGHAYNVFGSIEFAKSNYEETFKHWLQALKVYENYGDASRASAIQVNIGGLFSRQKNNEEALKYYLNAQEVIEKDLVKDSANISTKLRLFGIYNNIGMIFSVKKNYVKAKENYFKALQVAEQIKSKDDISRVFNNLGNVFKNENDLSKALEFYSKSLKIDQETENKTGMAIRLENIGNVMVQQGNYESALSYFNQGLTLAEEIGDKEEVKNIYDRLADLYSILGNNLAYEYCRKYSDLRDSIINKESSKQIAEMQTKYETGKKDAEIKLLNQINEVKDLQNKKQRIVIYSAVAGIFLFLLLALVIFRAYKSKKRANLHLAKQKQEIEIQNTHLAQQKEEIEHQAKEINDNIVYAKRIQNGVMPTLTAFQKRVPNSFVLFKPKDNVSGDFYWMETKGSITFFAAADCTGHGVSGAMVSMVCSSVLNRCVKDFSLVRPGEILDKATELVVEAFEKSEETIQDGMDISLCAFNSETDELLWAGANNPLYLFRKGELIEYKADKQHIGKHDNQKSFKTHRIQLQSGDDFYIFSDGYQTQLGGPEGPEGKKFMTKKFKNLLASIQERNMEAQSDVLNQAIEEWMKPNDKFDYEQTDDILIIGVNV